MNLENIILSEVRQKQMLYDVTHTHNLKIIQMNLYTKQKQTHRQKANLWLPKGNRAGKGRIKSAGLTDTNYTNS